MRYNNLRPTREGVRPLRRSALYLAMASLSVGLASSFPTASAQSLKERRAQAAEEAALQNEADYTANVCGTSIRATILWSTASTWPEGQSIAKACDGALGAIEAMCRTGREADVQSKIKSFQCLGDGSGPSLRGGTMTYGAAPGTNGYQQTRKYLERQL